jgi:hypothetical protein
MWKNCIDCGAAFYGEESWKVRCVPCWRKMKNRKDSTTAVGNVSQELANANRKINKLEFKIELLIDELIEAEQTSNIETELADRMRALISLVHPDKHGNSQTATDVTVWLLDIKEKAAIPGRHGGF